MSDKRSTFWAIALNVALTIGVLGIIILISVFAYKPDVINDEKFKITLAGNSIALLYLFTMYKFTNIKIVKKKDKGYQKANIIHSKMGEKVKADNMRDKVKVAVDKTNDANLREAQEKALESVTSLFTINEVLTWNEQELRSKAIENGLKAKSIKKLIKVAYKIKNGQVKYTKYTVDEILKNPTSDSVNKQVSAKMEKWITVWEIINKGVSYAVITAIFAMIDWDTANLMNLLKEILIRGSLVTSAIQSGLKSATLYVGRSKDRLCNKNDVLAQVDGINYATIEQEANSILTRPITEN